MHGASRIISPLLVSRRCPSIAVVPLWEMSITADINCRTPLKLKKEEDATGRKTQRGVKTYRQNPHRSIPEHPTTFLKLSSSLCLARRMLTEVILQASALAPAMLSIKQCLTVSFAAQDIPMVQQCVYSRGEAKLLFLCCSASHSGQGQYQQEAHLRSSAL